MFQVTPGKPKPHWGAGEARSTGGVVWGGGWGGAGRGLATAQW